MPQGSVLSPLLFLLNTSELFSILENKVIGYADDYFDGCCAIPRRYSYNRRVRDLGRVSEWCDLLGMKLNASKTKTMIVSRSRSMHPQSPPITIGRTVLKNLMTLLY